MSRNRNNRLLLIIFGILLVAVVANQLVKSSRGDRTFRKDLIEYPAEDISKIIFHSSGFATEGIELFKEDTLWRLRSEGKEYPADQSLAEGIAGELAILEPERLVANRKEAWSDYDVTDSAGIKMTISGPKISTTDLIVGRFAYNETSRQPITYVRLANDNEVFAVEGYLGLSFTRGLADLRDKSIFRGNRNDFTKITAFYPADSSFTLIKEGTKWVLDGGQKADSLKTMQFLNTLAYLTGTEFRDDFDTAGFTGDTYQITVEGINMAPVEIKGFNDPAGMVMQSSVNPQTFFNGETNRMAENVFRGRRFFIPN